MIHTSHLKELKFFCLLSTSITIKTRLEICKAEKEIRLLLLPVDQMRKMKMSLPKFTQLMAVLKLEPSLGRCWNSFQCPVGSVYWENESFQRQMLEREKEN